MVAFVYFAETVHLSELGGGRMRQVWVGGLVASRANISSKVPHSCRILTSLIRQGEIEKRKSETRPCDLPEEQRFISAGSSHALLLSLF